MTIFAVHIEKIQHVWETCILPLTRGWTPHVSETYNSFSSIRSGDSRQGENKRNDNMYDNIRKPHAFAILPTKVVFVLASNHFRKSFSVNAGVWLRMENGFSGKEFPLTVKLRPLTRKIFSAKILPSNHFRRRAKRERERERTHAHTERERLRTQKVEIIAPPARSSNPRTANPRTHERRTHEPTTHEQRTHERRTHEQRTHDPRMANP